MDEPEDRFVMIKLINICMIDRYDNIFHLCEFYLQSHVDEQEEGETSSLLSFS